jgi:hypothetical protein
LPQVLVEVDAGGSWVHSVAWSPSGSTLAFCSHDACVRFLQGLTFQQQGPQGEEQQQQVRGCSTAQRCPRTRCPAQPHLPPSTARAPPRGATSRAAPDAHRCHHPRPRQQVSTLQLDGLPLKVLLPLGEGCFVTGGWDGHMHMLLQQPGGGWRASRLPTGGLSEGSSQPHAQQASSLIAAKMEQLRMAGSGGSPKAADAAAAAGGARGGRAKPRGCLHAVLRGCERCSSGSAAAPGVRQCRHWR